MLIMLYVAAVDRNVCVTLLKNNFGVNFIPTSPHTNRMQSGSKPHKLRQKSGPLHSETERVLKQPLQMCITCK